MPTGLPKFPHTAGRSVFFEYTWTCEDGVITMTSVSNPSEVITSTAEGGVTTIVYAASLGGNNVELTFTCGDISALEDVLNTHGRAKTAS